MSPNPLRMALRLALGTTIVRGVSVLSQFVLAIWLTPSDFGTFAAAIAATSLVAGLTNMGEVNALMSGHGRTFSQTRRRIWRVNAALAAIGLGLAGVYASLGKPEVSILIVICAMTIPVTGEADLLYARAVLRGRTRQVVISQAVAVSGKAVVGIVLCWVFHSPVGLAVSLTAFQLISVLLLWDSETDEAGSEESPNPTGSFSWAMNSFAVTLNLQSATFALQFVLSDRQLGLFYLASQASLGIASLAAGPISKSSIATLRGLTSTVQAAVANWLMLAVSSAGGLIVILIGLLALSSSLLVVDTWKPIIGLSAVLLMSVPARLVTPIADACHMVNNKWHRSTIYTLSEFLATTLVCLVIASMVSLMAVVVMLSFLKAFIALLRSLPIARVGPISAHWMATSAVAPLLLIPLFAVGAAWWSSLLAAIGFGIGCSLLAMVLRTRPEYS